MSKLSDQQRRPLKDVWLVYRREIDARLSTKGFYIGMAFMVLAVFGLLVGLDSANAPKTRTIAVCGTSATAFGPAPDGIQLRPCADAQEARHKTDSKDVDAAVAVHNDSATVLLRADTPEQAKAAAISVARAWATTHAYQQQHIDVAELEKTIAQAGPQLVTVGDGSASPTQVGAAVSMIVVLFMQIIGQGSIVAQGVVEEKSTRIIEVLLSTLTPLRLMIGKVAGIGTAAVLQILALGVGVVGANALTSGSSGTMPGTAGLICAALWFLLSFALFACLFAAAGSLVSRPEDLQSVMMPVMVLAMAPVGVAAAAAGSLSSTWVSVMQYIPPFSGMLMPLKASVGMASVSEQLIAAAVMILATAGCMQLAARIYRNSILKVGATVSWRHALAA
jgi:ABC-2 type transport system permease protein